jgi:hypothetical protein
MIKVILLLLVGLMVGCNPDIYHDRCKQSELFKMCVSDMSSFNYNIVDSCKEVSYSKSRASLEQIPKECQ